MQNSNEGRDINDVFDNLLFVEDDLIKEGYQEGFKTGSKEENTEGFHLGYHRGAEIGAELGYYLGVTESILNDQSNLTDKIVGQLTNIINHINNFPKDNVEDVDIVHEFDMIKTLFRKVSAILKIDVAFPEIDQLSF